MRVAVSTFVQTSTITPVKTKLAQDIGQDNAEKFYFSCINAIEKKMFDLKKLCADIHPYWAIAEQEGLSNPIWMNLNKIYTGEGALGDKLERVYSNLRIGYDYVVMMGVDSPQIPNELIIRVIDDLASHDCVVGKNHDGGIYLFAGGSQIPKEVWADNADDDANITADQLIDNLKSNGKTVALLPSFASVNEASDLQLLMNEMHQHDAVELSTLKQIIPEFYRSVNFKTPAMQGA